MQDIKPDSLYGRAIGWIVAVCLLIQPFFILLSAKPVFAESNQKTADIPPEVPTPAPWLPPSSNDEAVGSLGWPSLSVPRQGRSGTGGGSLPGYIGIDFAGDSNNARVLGSGSGGNSPGGANQAGAGGANQIIDPVILSNGEFVRTDTDLNIPARGIPIQISRTYRSRQQHPGVLGYNWFFSYESRALKTTSGNYEVLEMGGRRETYTKNGTTWTSPVSHFDTLTEQQDGSIKITKKDGSYLQYDNLGRLTSLVDRFGNHLDFGYSATKQALVGKSDFFWTVSSGLIAMVYQLNSIKDSYGREVTIAYYDATSGNKAGRIQSVTDFLGRQVVYDYDNNGDLVSVRSPVTADYPQGKTVHFTYSSGNSDPVLNHNLLTVIDAKNQTCLTNVYDTSDRITQQTVGGGSWIVSYTQVYSSGYTQKATVTDRNGNISNYDLDSSGMVTKVVQQTNRNIRANEGDYTTTSTFDVNHLCTAVTHPRGNGIKYTYDSTGNVVSTRAKTDMQAQDSVNDLVTQIEYEPLFNQVKRTVDCAGNVWINIFDYEEAHKLSPPATGGTTWVYNSGNAGLGDVNGDGTTAQAFGLVVARKFVGPNDGANDTNSANDGVSSGQPSLQGIQGTFVYNNFGQLLCSTNPQNVATQYDYYPENDPDGDGQDVIAGHGTSHNGYLRQVVVDAGAGKLNLATQYGYDRVGNVVSETNPRNFTTTYTVNALNQVTKVDTPTVTLGGGATATYETQLQYDENNMISKRRVHNIDEAGSIVSAHEWIETTYTYDIMNHIISSTEDIGPDPNNINTILKRTTNFEYDNNGNRTKVIKPEGNVVQYVYDERDLVYKVITDPNVGQPAPAPISSTVTMDYDGNRNLTLLTNPLGHASSFTYDLFDRRTQTVDALGNKTLNTFDNNSNLIAVEAQNSSGTTYARTENVYDELNRAYEMHRWISGPTNNASNYLITKVLYDKNSRVTKITDSNNHNATFAYDNADREIGLSDELGNSIAHIYDTNGNLIQAVLTELQPGTPSSRTFTLASTFDEVDRVVSTRDQGPDGTYNNTDDRSASLKYDSRGNLVKRTDPKGAVMQMAYDALGRRTQIQRDAAGLNIITKFAFDKNSRLSQYTGIRNNSDAAAQYHTTNYSYDRADRVLQVSYADGQNLSVTRDAAGNVTTSTDPNGSVATMTYDNLERMTAISVTPGTGVGGTTSRSYTYDAISRMTSAADNNGTGTTDDTALSWTYDGLSRVLTEAQQFGAAATPTVNKTVAYTFNDGAPTPDRINLTKVTYPDSSVIRFGRDVLNRVANLYSGDNTTNTLASFSYAGAARTVGRTYYNGSAAPVALGTLSNTFDGVKRVASYYNRYAGGSEIASFDYGYDKADNRVYTKCLHALGTGEIYRYDTDYRAKEAYYGSSAGDISAAIVSVNAGNDPAAANAYASSKTYSLDNLGNRNSMTTAGVNGQNPTTTTYTSSQAGSDYKMNRYSSVGGTINVHDANGNLTDDGTWLYSYDAFNRIIGVLRKSDNAQIAVYKYDALGRRVRKTVSNSTGFNGTTHLIYQGVMVLEEYAVINPGSSETLAEAARYVNGRMIDERICMERQDTADVDGDGNTAEFQRFYYYTDALGSVRAVTWLNPATNAEQLVERVDYDIYGKATFTNWGADRSFGTADDATSSTSLVGNSFLFTGQTYDTETGNYYYRNRYYSPTTGRFLSQDSKGYINGPNMYQYCGSRPATFTDPLGTEWFSLSAAAGVFSGAANCLYNAGQAIYNATGCAAHGVESLWGGNVYGDQAAATAQTIDRISQVVQHPIDTLQSASDQFDQALDSGNMYAAGQMVGHTTMTVVIMADGAANIYNGVSAVDAANGVSDLGGILGITSTSCTIVVVNGTLVVQGTAQVVGGLVVLTTGCPTGGGAGTGSGSSSGTGSSGGGSNTGCNTGWKGTQGHHPICQFLGGKAKQLLTKLPGAVHKAFHQALANKLKGLGMPNVGGPGGSAADWAKYFAANPGAQEAAMNALTETALEIEQQFPGYHIVEDLLTNLIGGNYTPIP